VNLKFADIDALPLGLSSASIAHPFREMLNNQWQDRTTEASITEEDSITILTDLEAQIDLWVRTSDIGLTFDPFRERDAAYDPHLSHYLVDSGAFADLLKSKPSFVFAPVGGGKTAFRVRLTHACRTGEGERPIFPIVLTTVDPLMPFLQDLLKSAASEFLLHFLYVPQHFETLDHDTQQRIYNYVAQNLGGDLANHLGQIASILNKIEVDGDWCALVESFDPAACSLYIPPNLSEIRGFLRRLEQIAPSESEDRSLKWWFTELRMLTLRLGYQEIFVLIDGLDAYLETQRDPERALELLKPFLDAALPWTKRNIYLKLFLPIELENPIRSQHNLLTDSATFDTISWKADELRQVVAQRLRAAATQRRVITSLDALSTPGLRDIEDALIDVLISPLPREMIILAEQVFIEHVLRMGPEGRLEPDDLDAAIRWYQRFRRESEPT
jgi:hypothetical protein